MKLVKKMTTSKKSSRKTFDVNGDGKVNYSDILDLAKGIAAKMTPSRSLFDLNGDGVIDSKDAVVGAKLAGGVIAGVGATIGAGAAAGALIVSGTAASIATGVVATAGAAAGGFLGSVLGTSTTVAYAAHQTASGILIISAVKATTVSSPLIAAFTTVGSSISAMNGTLVAQVAGTKVIQALALKSAVASKGIVVILGVPIAREVALAAGLISIVIVAGYAYFLLNKDVEKQQVLDLTGAHI